MQVEAVDFAEVQCVEGKIVIAQHAAFRHFRRIQGSEMDGRVCSFVIA